MTIILTIHSITRWLVTLAALALIIRLILGLVRKMPFDKNATALTGAFSGLMDLQMLLGILYFILDGLARTGFPLYRWEHAGIMLLAVSRTNLVGVVAATLAVVSARFSAGVYLLLAYRKIKKMSPFRVQD